jgi:HEAT repeat protein
MLIDRAGNDCYRGETTAQGAAINNSFAMLLDEAGDDSYTGTDPKQSQAAGHDGDKREYGSVALMLDWAGKDWYSQGQSNNAVWLKPWYGAGFDTEHVGAPLWPRPAALEQPTWRPPGRCYKVAAVDPHQPMERLLRVAISDRPDAAEAWDKLKGAGTNALAYLVTRLDSPNVLVRVKTEELVDHLGTNAVPVLIAGIASAKNDEVARLCCYFLARFDERARAAIPRVLPLLNRDITRSVAFYTLGHLRAREVFAPAMAALNERELVRLRATQALARIGDRRAIPALIAKLDDELYDVRYAAEDALVGFGKSSIGPLRRAFAKAGPRARPHIVAALARLGDTRALALAEQEYRRDDRRVREAVMRSLRAALAGAK